MANTNAACKSRFSKTKVTQCRRQFRGKVGSDGFEKVLIGTRRNVLTRAEGRAAKNSVMTSGAKQLNASASLVARALAKLTSLRVCDSVCPYR